MDNAKENREELKEMLAAFNAIAKSDVAAADKETPVKVRKWWDDNQAKFQRTDAELAAKYVKTDAEARKAPDEAAEAAKLNEAKK